VGIASQVVENFLRGGEGLFSVDVTVLLAERLDEGREAFALGQGSGLSRELETISGEELLEAF
jgi:hypothetical protein